MNCKGTDTRLRRATSVDIPALVAVEAHDHARWNDAAFANELATAWSQVWVLESTANAAVLGFMVIWQVVDEIQLLNIAVAPGHRRQGHGRSMLEALDAHAHAQQVDRLVLEVRRDNASAQQLYTQRGFAVVGTRPGYYSDTGEDAILMEQRIAWNR